MEMEIIISRQYKSFVRKGQSLEYTLIYNGISLSSRKIKVKWYFDTVDTTKVQGKIDHCYYLCLIVPENYRPNARGITVFYPSVGQA